MERDTGIPKETLRVWERRYGFPTPGRDAQDDRLYSAEDLEKLRVVRRLISSGFRPGRIMQLDLDALTELSTGSPSGEPEEIRRALDLLVANQVERLEAELGATLFQDGLKNFVLNTAPRMTVAVGDAWARGEIRIHHEHAYSEIITRLLRTAIAGTPRKSRPPRILLTTFPIEPHAIGLLMAEAMFAICGCACVSLGVQTPIPDIAMAACDLQADIVALSFSKSLATNRVTAGLADLRLQLPESLEIWAGGSSDGLARVKSVGIHVLTDLAKIPESVNGWRKSHQSA